VDVVAAFGDVSVMILVSGLAIFSITCCGLSGAYAKPMMERSHRPSRCRPRPEHERVETVLCVEHIAHPRVCGHHADAEVCPFTRQPLFQQSVNVHRLVSAMEVPDPKWTIPAVSPAREYEGLRAVSASLPLT